MHPELAKGLVYIGAAAPVNIGTVDDADVILAIANRAIAFHILRHVGARQIIVMLGVSLTVSGAAKSP